MASRRQIPPPSRPRRRQKLVPVPLWVAGKLARYQAMREHLFSNVDLALRLGVSETAVRRMLDPDHDTKIEKPQTAIQRSRCWASFSVWLSQTRRDHSGCPTAKRNGGAAMDYGAPPFVRYSGSNHARARSRTG